MDVFELDKQAWEKWVESKGEKKFRAKQIMHWLYERKVLDPEEMLNLSNAIKENLKNDFNWQVLELQEELISVKDPGTEKLLFVTQDKNYIEAVLLPNSKGKQTLCLSSQVGCAMACSFCATGALSFTRNLTLSEILYQVFWALKNKDISNIVFMGMGEPLLHPKLELVLSRLIEGDYFNLAARGITVSTVGIADQIERLIPFKQVKLAWSLHSTLEERRKKLFPVLAKKYSYRQIVEALKDFQAVTKKRITLEYLVIRGVNDDQKEWDRLIALNKQLHFHVNLIAYNPHPYSAFKAPEMSALYKIQEQLIREGLEVTIRKSLGQDIQGACGQLAGKKLAENDQD